MTSCDSRRFPGLCSANTLSPAPVSKGIDPEDCPDFLPSVYERMAENSYGPSQALAHLGMALVATRRRSHSALRGIPDSGALAAKPASPREALRFLDSSPRLGLHSYTQALRAATM
jgi:hypothetical protein